MDTEIQHAVPPNLVATHPPHRDAGDVEAPVEAEGALQPPSNRFKHVASLIALLATELLAALNTTIVATATPTICKELNSAEGYAWIGGAYLLGTACFAPIWAKLSDIWGRKAILLCIVAGFACSSIFCALSVNMTMLIVGRAIQGSFGGGVESMVAIVLSDLFSVRQRSLYMGLFELIWTLFGGIGPVLGGVFAEHLSWRWIFWIMLPPCGISLLLLILTLNIHNPRTRMLDGLKAIDWAGSICILSLLSMFLLGLSFGGVEFPWNSPTVLCLILIGALMGVGFVFSEKKLARYPLMPLGVFTKRSSLAIILVAFVQCFALASSEFYLPFFFQSARALSPVGAGTLILPTIVSASAMSVVAGWYMDRTGRYLELFWIGLTLDAAGMGSFLALTPTSSLALIVCTQLLVGIGTGLLFSPPIIAIQASVSQQEASTATATLSTIRSFATILALVLGQVIFQHGISGRQGELMAAGLNTALQDAFQGSNAAANVDLIATIQDPSQKLTVEQAFAASLRGLWIMGASLVVLGLLSVPFIVRSQLSEEHTETRTGLPTDVKTPPTLELQRVSAQDQ